MNITELIIFEGEDLIALNKPSGLLSIPDRLGKEISLKKILQEKYEQIFTVHRLDKGTSGVIVFAKNETSHRYLSNQFEQRQTEKIYLGLVIGSPDVPKGSIDAPIAEHPGKNGLMIIHRKGKEALTDYELAFLFNAERANRLAQFKAQANTIGWDDVLDAIINPSETEIFIEKGEWNNDAVINLKNKIQRMAVADAQSRGLLRQSEEKATQILTDFFMAAGYKKVVIEFKQTVPPHRFG